MRQLFAALVLALASAAPALADGLIIVQRSPPDMPHLRNVPLWVRSHAVTVKVEGRVAVTEVDQVFVNPNPRQLEGTYLFPLPEGATIDRFSMWIDGKETVAELLDAAKARGIYEGIVRQMRDPALLEYAERGLFKARVFPIDANGEKRVKIRYAETLSADNGTVAYRYPLNTEKFTSRPLESVGIGVTIDAGGPIAALYSPSHKIDVPRDLTGVVKVGWEARGVTPDRDFLLYWRPTKKDVGISVLAHRDPSDPEGTFLMVLAARAGNENAPSVPKDVVFVVDTSGSMAGPKMEQARGALHYCLRSLGEADRFGLVPFATEPRPFRDALVPANAENRAAAEKFVDTLEAKGGTAIDDALAPGLALVALRPEEKTARPTIVLFLTDGLPTIGESDVDKILKNAASRSGEARLFVFGVGDDVNTKLLDRLAAENRGTRDYVATTESIEEKVSNLYAKLAKPAMTDVELKIDGVATSAVHPARLPDLFHGSEILVAGRYAAPGSAVVRVRGKIQGVATEIVEEIRFPESEPRHEFLPRLWAVRRVGYLLDEMRLRPPPVGSDEGGRLGGSYRGPKDFSGVVDELRDEIVKLARRFGIVTPFTSYLILEDETKRRGLSTTGAAERARTPDFAFGVDNLSTAGGSAGGGGGGGSAVGGSASGGGDSGGGPAAPLEERLDRSALASAAKSAGESKESESGAGAVRLSMENLRLAQFEGEKDAKRDSAGRRIVRHLGGRTFVAKGGIWWDAGVDLRKERRVIEAFSDAYFELVRVHPEIGTYLTLDNVVFALGKEVIEVRPTP